MPQRLGLLKGHTQSVLCCKNGPAQALLASGSEDGTVCLQDLRQHSLIQRIDVSKEDAVTSLAFDACNEHTLWGSAGCAVCQLDTRQTGAKALICQQPCAQAEINCLVQCPDGNSLAVVDDNGHVTIIADVQQPQHALPEQLKGGHDNICSSIAFRRHKPNQVITGGLDCKIIQWDSTARSMLSMRHTGDEASQSEAKVCNPPMVHGLAVPPTAETPAAHMVAAACGDGVIRIWDLDKVTSNKGPTRAKQRQPVCVLGHPSSAHRAAATCVHFLDANAQRLISGGNDRQVKLWRWQSATGTVEACWQLKRKVNALALKDDKVFVADTSSIVSIYALTV